MNVGMRDFETCHHDSDALAGHGFFEPDSGFFGKAHEGAKFFVGESEKIIAFFLGNDERVAPLDGTDVQEGEVVFVFHDLVAGDLSADDFRKEGRHFFSLLAHGGQDDTGNGLIMQ